MYHMANDSEIIKAVGQYKKNAVKYKIPSNEIPKFLVQEILHDTQIFDLQDSPIIPWQLTHHLLQRSRWILEALDAGVVFADTPVQNAADKRKLSIFKKEYNAARARAIELCNELMKRIEENPDRYNEPERLKIHNLSVEQKYQELVNRYSLSILWHLPANATRERASYTLLYYLPLADMPWMLLEEDYETWADMVIAFNAMLSVIDIILFRFRGARV